MTTFVKKKKSVFVSAYIPNGTRKKTVVDLDIFKPTVAKIQ
jgi:hypothetical protein